MAVYAGMQCTVVAVSQAVTGMKAMFSQVKFSGQSCSIFDELWFLTHCCDTSSEFLNKADACAVMNDCNQFNFLFFFHPKVQPNFALQKYVSACVCSQTSLSLQPSKKEMHRKYLDIGKLWLSVRMWETTWPHLSIGNRSSSHLGWNPTQRGVRTENLEISLKGLWTHIEIHQGTWLVSPSCLCPRFTYPT